MLCEYHKVITFVIVVVQNYLSRKILTRKNFTLWCIHWLLTSLLWKLLHACSRFTIIMRSYETRTSLLYGVSLCPTHIEHRHTCNTYWWNVHFKRYFFFCL